MISTQTVTRPANTTQYTAGDVVTGTTAATIPFSGVAAPGGGGWIVGASLIGSANQTTKPQLELYLFDTDFTPEADNAAWAPTDDVLKSCFAVIQFNDIFVGNAGAGADGNIYADGTVIGSGPKYFSLASGLTTVYGLLVVRNAYTPVSAETFTVRLVVQPDIGF